MSMKRTTQGKALFINQDLARYGAFAEIGAGQEVARHFFQAGKASQTIAKTISAYDMIYSDEIYGKEKSGRYVCESRLIKMLEKEASLLERRLKTVRGDKTCFFAFANTVTTGSEGNQRYCHGWIGARFQQKPHGPYNDIAIHVKMLDRYRLEQQETLGKMGVNLLSAAFYASNSPQEFIAALTDDIKPGQIAIDMIRITGEDLPALDTRLVNLEVVRRGWGEAVLFGPDGHVQSLAETTYGKPILFQRGTYRPISKSNLEILKHGLEQFKKDLLKPKDEPMVLLEITLHNLEQTSQYDEKDFLDRIDTLCALGHYVLISNFFLFFQAKKYFRQFTKAPMGVVMGATHLDKLFDESHYKDLEGGLLEGLGKLLDDQTRIYVYPVMDNNTCISAKTFFPAAHVKKIYEYFREQKQVVDLADCDTAALSIHSRELRKMLVEGNPQWEKSVPTEVVKLIKTRKLFGYHAR